jgi:hypothetical protein
MFCNVSEQWRRTKRGWNLWKLIENDGRGGKRWRYMGAMRHGEWQGRPWNRGAIVGRLNAKSRIRRPAFTLSAQRKLNKTPFKETRLCHNSKTQ